MIFALLFSKKLLEQNLATRIFALPKTDKEGSPDLAGFEENRSIS